MVGVEEVNWFWFGLMWALKFEYTGIMNQLFLSCASRSASKLAALTQTLITLAHPLLQTQEISQGFIPQRSHRRTNYFVIV